LPCNGVSFIISKYNDTENWFQINLQRWTISFWLLIWLISIWITCYNAGYESQSDFASSKFSSCSPNKKITNQENIVNLILHQNNLQTLSTNIKLPLIKVTGINTFNKTLSGLTRLVLQPMLNIYLTFNFLS
jgi:hypothetical protein